MESDFPRDLHIDTHGYKSLAYKINHLDSHITNAKCSKISFYILTNFNLYGLGAVTNPRLLHSKIGWSCPLTILYF